MKKLLKMFKSLPREVKMMIAMAGMGTPIGAVYLLKRFLFPNTPTIYVIFGIAIAIGVICLLGFILTKIFKRGSKKRSKRMADDLASDASGGRVSMDVGAAIKENNDKFFGVIRDMKKNVGISVYDLPWYIVIGDSGCGKTKLINEGGLQFSTGKPEGYQLGTLNYNWWFTEDAVFVDMAGRLCNPRDDADRAEWDAFLNTIGKGRKGFPINGTIVCVSVDHLLQDPPEKVEEMANTTLERLRDLQTKLGVTFATYLVLTKCDKIVGFMQFFDRAERDIQVLNQMFGWSKPGEFNELHDPEDFPEAFKEVYDRLYELRLRRLNDEADEIDLGLAYSFPEEFRELRDPLQTWIRTLFPKIKNPRAIKNLIFRGIYFTSATREGGLILKHLTDRLGPEAAEQFAPLDLYPSKRPYFIKDLLFRKVFPEHGLVFRNEQDLVRNRRLAKFLKFGSVMLAVVLIGTVAMAASKFSALIGEPRLAAQAPVPLKPPLPHVAVGMGTDLRKGVKTLKSHSFWATLLSLGFGSDRPVRGLETVQAGMFEEFLLDDVLASVAKGLRETRLEDPGAGETAITKGQEYLEALDQFVAWYGCMDNSDGTPAPDHINADSFVSMSKVVTERIDKESLLVDDTTKNTLLTLADSYFAVVHADEEWPNPARLLKNEGINAEGTIIEGLRRAHQFLEGYAKLTDRHPNEKIREWMRIQKQCQLLRETYDTILETDLYAIDTPDALEAFRKSFLDDYQSFAGAADGIGWHITAGANAVKIDDLRTLLWDQRKTWLEYQEKLKGSLAGCETTGGQTVGGAIAALNVGGREAGVLGLDRVLWTSLQEARMTTPDYDKSYFEAEDLFTNNVKELTEPYSHIFSLTKGEGEFSADALLPSPSVGVVRRTLGDIQSSLAGVNFGPRDNPGQPSEWTDELEGLLAAEGGDAANLDALDALGDIWEPDKLSDLYAAHKDVILRGQGRSLLDTMTLALGSVGEWGFAELYTDQYRVPVPSVYRIPVPRASADEGKREAKTDESKREKRKPRQRRAGRRGRRRGGDRQERAHTPRGPSVQQGVGKVPTSGTQPFLFRCADDCAYLLNSLSAFNADFYLQTEGEELNRTCLLALEDAMRSYMQTYVRNWRDTYGNTEFTELGHLAANADDWGALAQRLKTSSGRGSKAMELVGQQLLQLELGLLQSIPFWQWDLNPELSVWENLGEIGDPEFLTIDSWMQQVISNDWPSDRQFAGNAIFPSDLLSRAKPDDPPWVSIAEGFYSRWRELAVAIKDNATLPRSFSSAPTRTQQNKRRIQWGAIKELRDAARLDDERYTQELNDFEKNAQRLLSAELTDILVGIQSRHLKDATPWDGWPYLGSRGDLIDGLKTVDFNAFAKFLREVSYAEQHFAPLEEDLPDSDEFLGARKTFYLRCREWRTFLGMKGSSLDASELALEVEATDPVVAKLPSGVVVNATPDKLYSTIELDLQCKVEDGNFVKGPLVIETDPEMWGSSHQRRARWEWSKAAGNQSITVRFATGQKPDWATEPLPTLEKRIGDASPLALCAYFHRHATGSGREWIVTHSFDMPAELKSKGKGSLAQRPEIVSKRWYGMSFKFRLDRTMPDPIVKLAR